MSATVIGLNDFTLTSTSRTWSKDNGQGTVKNYEGPIDKIKEFFESQIDDPAIDTMRNLSNNGKGVLEVTFVDDDGSGEGLVTAENNDIWELIGQDLFKNIRAHETFNVDNDQPALEEVRKAVEAADKDLQALTAGEPQETYQKLLLQGTDEYARTAVILRRSINAGSRTLLQASWLGVDRAWELDNEVGSPNLRTTGDAAIIGAIAEMPDEDGTKKQWLKRAPQIRTQGRRSWSIVQEWWFARRWSATLYEGDAEAGNP